MVSLRKESAVVDFPTSLAQSPIFSLSGRQIKVSKGESIFSEGSECVSVHYLCDGLLGLRKSDSNGRSVLVRLVHPGALVGQTGGTHDEVHQAGAEALAECNIYSVPVTAFRARMACSHGLRQWVYSAVAAELSEAETRILHLAGYPAKARLALFLLQSAGAAQGIVHLPLCRHELADYLGIRPETLARVARKLEETEMVTFQGREVVIHDAMALRELSAAAE